MRAFRRGLYVVKMIMEDGNQELEYFTSGNMAQEKRKKFKKEYPNGKSYCLTTYMIDTLPDLKFDGALHS